MANKIWIIAAAILYACLIGGLLYLNSMREYAEGQLEYYYACGFVDGQSAIMAIYNHDEEVMGLTPRKARLKFWHKSLDGE